MEKLLRIFIKVAIVAVCIYLAISVFDIFLKVVVPILAVLTLFMFLLSSKNKNDKKTVTAIFSGSELDFSGEPFFGGRFTAIFGGIDCNLKGALIEDGAVLKATAVFGGIDIIVPQGVNVKVSSTSLFGGVSQMQSNTTDYANTLYINATCIFGGVDII